MKIIYGLILATLFSSCVVIHVHQVRPQEAPQTQTGDDLEPDGYSHQES